MSGGHSHEVQDIDKRVCAHHGLVESNATVELLAIALFIDATSGSYSSVGLQPLQPVQQRWCQQSHMMREHFREMAQGRAELGSWPRGKRT